MRKTLVVAASVLAALAGAAPAGSVELPRSLFDDQLNQIRYVSNWNAEESSAAGDEQAPPAGESWATEGPKLKSPARAFFYSLAVPGLGQFYYGSKVKPLVFVAAEATSWFLYFKWHGDGDDLTKAYEAFNVAHWSQSDYEQQLRWTYRIPDSIVVDDDNIDSMEITHHLPSERSQQYYEMTGKYDQFAWGWDDAVLHDTLTLDSFSATDPPPRIRDDASTPYSANRFVYEDMRESANARYDRATRMIYVSIANRLLSAFEAYFAVKSRNNKIKRDTWGLERVKVRTDLKSYYSSLDTPFVTVACSF
ncbi:MAG TPA: hypothetical protein VN285_12595 [Candidatus Deferrimicrobium sp.]|nr:hypothetical protein [Candidatus Deferrimicrobium sp.]